MTHMRLQQVRQYAETHFDETLKQLCDYLKVPAISCEPARHEDVRRLASKISEDLERLGFESQIRTVPGALPIVSASHGNSKDRPTVLIYGHLDLQPVAGEAWLSSPHEGTIRNGRLYARGAADDMGGWVSHLAALKAWFACAQELPCNVKLLIESEEEIGSPNLERYMDAFPEAFSADVMVLTDCENPSTDIPGLTVSLRGLLEVELRCEALGSDVHSGLWGNMAPDVNNTLIYLLARLLDDDARLRLGRVEPDASFRALATKVPLSEADIRAGAHILDSVEVLPERGRPAAEWLWRQPAVTVLSTTLPAPHQHKNALRASASATLSIRLAPGQTRRQMLDLLQEQLCRNVPANVRVGLVERPGGADSWLYELKGPAFSAVDRAYEQAFGHKPLPIGIGGSIPFVALFGRRYQNLPLILNGVMDPLTGAHGPNESLHLGLFNKAILANVFLLDELAGTLGSG